ncbi:hypothetical protein LCGC14_1478920 [marine sediment metagenome]|uniref:Flagellar basal body L-ring protein n=1 Tax=marine sediment metagenome TaxID=412755 RepID=A0A0F9JA45_9ZZZZ
MSFLIRFLALSSLILLSACTTTEVKRDPAYAAVRPVALPEHPNTDGAIFNVANNVSFYEDYRARRVGDILTVKLDEKTSAEKTSATTVKKSNSNDIASPTILGSGNSVGRPKYSKRSVIFLPRLLLRFVSLPCLISNFNDFSFNGTEFDLFFL